MKYVLNALINYRTEDGAMWLGSDERSAITLTLTMNRLLSLLIERRGLVVPRDEILEIIWDRHGLRSSNNTLNKYISELRKLFVGYGIKEECIVTIPRVGFMFSSDIEIKAIPQESSARVEHKFQGVAKIDKGSRITSYLTTHAFHYSLLAIVSAVFVLSLIVFLQFMDPKKVMVQREMPLYFLFTYESCPVYTLQNNSTSLHSQKQDIFMRLVNQKGIKCLPDSTFMYQSSESYLYGHKGRNFISRCTSDKKNYISCLNYYWSGYEIER